MKHRILLLFVFASFIQMTYCQAQIWPIFGEKGIRFINKSGKILFNTNFYLFSEFHEGLAWFSDSTGHSGYIDTTGKVIIYGRGFFSPFSDGLATYYQHDTLTFIDKKGRIVLVPKYENYYLGFIPHNHAPSFSEGLAPLLINRKDSTEWYNFIFINKKGEKVFNKNFRYAGNFSEGLAYVELLNGECGYINKQSQLVIPLKRGAWGDEFKENFAVISDTFGFHYIDRHGGNINNQIYKNANSFSDGMARIEINGKLGFINTKGELVIKPIYDYTSTDDFSDGLAPVSITIPGENHHYTFFIDKTGKACSKMFKNAIIRSFKNGLAYGTIRTAGCKSDFYINKSGEIVWGDTICNSTIKDNDVLLK